MTDQATTANQNAVDPLQAEALALAVAFGVRYEECDIRNVKVKVREFVPDDLQMLYTWLIEIRQLFVTIEGVAPPDARQLIEHAVASGTGILSLVTDGAIPADMKLPMSVIGKLIDTIITVNEDFFEVLPSLMRLFGGLPGLVGNVTGSAAAQTEPDATATASVTPVTTEPVRVPRDYPEPPLAQPDAGHSSSDASGAQATP